MWKSFCFLWSFDLAFKPPHCHSLQQLASHCERKPPSSSTVLLILPAQADSKEMYSFCCIKCIRCRRCSNHECLAWRSQQTHPRSVIYSGKGSCEHYLNIPPACVPKGQLTLTPASWPPWHASNGTLTALTGSGNYQWLPEFTHLYRLKPFFQYHK